jgi:hypothetical protein
LGWLQALAAEVPITLSDGAVWLSIGQGLLFGAVCLVFGTWLARFVGLLESDAPAGETLGVGLASGLLVLASWWAAIASGGRSSYTPVAVGFGIAIALALVRRARSTVEAGAPDAEPSPLAVERATSPIVRNRAVIAAALGGAVFIVAVALSYGSTIVLSPRDGVQPLEFQDAAFYAVLGADLARTGTETIYSPSGFAGLEGLPDQTWYHWGEVWLAAALIRIFGMAPLAARYFVVLPILLLAAAALTGTVVRRITGSASRGAFLFGFLACLFLAPMPLILGTFFSTWAAGLIFGITSYGLAAVAVLLALYGLAVLGTRRATWGLASFVGSAAALIVPAHLVIAVLGLVGIGSVWAIRITQSLVATRRIPAVAPVWQRTIIATGVAVVVTVAWGLLTGHGVGGSGISADVTPFNASWRESVAITVICSGAILGIAVAWGMVRKEAPLDAGLYLGTAIVLVTGALLWGARLADFNTFHLFYGGIAVFATPVAAVALVSIWLRLRTSRYRRIVVIALVLCVAQLEFGVASGVVRLQGFGPGSRLAPQAVPLAILAAIEGLPSDAKVAYACQPFEDGAFWNPSLIAFDVHTGRRIVPMCFEASYLGQLTGGHMSPDIASPLFTWAPQRTLYPDSGARPSPASMAAFLQANGIDYIYVDRVHSNTLVPGATPIATSGQTQVLRLP